MKCLFIIFASVLFFTCAPSLAESYIVMFEQSERPLASLEHGQLQQFLQSSNTKKIKQLLDWLGRGKRGLFLKDLWLARAAVVELSEEQAKHLEKEAWVYRVYPNDKLQLIRPVPKPVKEAKPAAEPDKAWGLNYIGLDKIKEKFPELDGTGVRVGVLDSGIEPTHPEFNQAKANHIIAFKDFVNDRTDPYDDEGHGSHVAGTIAGKTVGVAPKVSLIIGKVLDEFGGGTWDGILSGMQWIFDPDGNSETADFPQVVNSSWGAYLPGTTANDLTKYEPFQAALQTWVQGGIVPIFAAGNSGVAPNGFPGGLAEVIAVGGLDPSGETGFYSSKGPNIWRSGSFMTTVMKPDLSAPGTDIYSCALEGDYVRHSGTSMAAPHVTGVVALLLQLNSKLNFADVKERLLVSSVLKKDIDFGYGILDAFKLIEFEQKAIVRDRQLVSLKSLGK